QGRTMNRARALVLFSVAVGQILVATAPALAAKRITEYPIPTRASLPYGIADGPDGNLWFTETVANKVGRSTTDGAMTEYPVPTAHSYPSFIAAGPDSNVWFTELMGNKIGRITAGGVITEYPLPTAGSCPEGITAGPDGNLWFTE